MNKEILVGWGMGYVQPETGECTFLTNNDELGLKSEKIKFSGKSNEAKIFKNFNLLLDFNRKLLKKKSLINPENIKIIKLYSKFEIIDLSDDLYAMEIRKRAIKKLEDDEIDLLGLQNDAVYVKLDETEKNYLEDFYPNERS